MYKDGASEVGLDPEHSPQVFISDGSLVFLCNQSGKDPAKKIRGIPSMSIVIENRDTSDIRYSRAGSLGLLFLDAKGHSVRSLHPPPCLASGSQWH